MTRHLPACAEWLMCMCAGLTLACGQTPPAAESGGRAASQTVAPALPAPAIDACALVTKAEAEAAIGQPLLDPAKSDSPGMYSCEFADPTQPIAKRLTVTVLVGRSPRDAQDAMDLAKSNAAADAVQDVPKLGDAAYWDRTLHALTVDKGRYQIEVFVDADAGLAAASTIAASAMARLPSGR
jgi:hypothetical protein